MKVVYYSCSGNSLKIANYIANKENCEALRLHTNKEGKTPGILMIVKSVMKKKIKLKNNYSNEIKKDKKLYVITPIWIGSLAAPIRTFLATNSFKNKEITLITVQSDPEYKDSNKVIKEMTEIIKSSKGKVTSSKKFTGDFYLDKNKKVDLDKQLEEKL